MFAFLTVIYVLVCLFLIFVVLLQPGRGGGLGGAFGGGASQQVFGGAGATNILQKMTAWSAAVFMVLSLVLAYLSSTDATAVDDAFETVGADVTPAAVGAEAAPAPEPVVVPVAPEAADEAAESDDEATAE